MTTPLCRFCGTPLTQTFIDLGRTPLANTYLTPGELAERGEKTFPLHARVCPACFLVQVEDAVPASEIFSDYAYFSSFSASWLAHAKAYAEMMVARFGLTANSLVIEIASNDGYLLRHFRDLGIPVLGVEPAANVAKAAEALGIETEIAFFGEETGRRLRHKGRQADLMAANNVLAHVPDIRDFTVGFSAVLKNEGVATFEFPHLLNLIALAQFDTIYHEHYSYLSLIAVERILGAAGLRVFDVEKLSTHGGSLRIFVCHGSASHRDTPALHALREEERTAGLSKLGTYEGFALRTEQLRRDFLDFLERAKAERKRVVGYGAAAKGNTMLNYCGIGPELIEAVADKNPAKQGRLLPGSRIPVVTPDDLLRLMPDYCVILPWNLADEIATEMAALRESGCRFVTAVPEIRVF